MTHYDTHGNPTNPVQGDMEESYSEQSTESHPLVPDDNTGCFYFYFYFLSFFVVFVCPNNTKTKQQNKIK